MSLRCEMNNAISLCYRCHIYIWHKNPLEAHDWFSKKYPGRWEELREEALASIGKKVDWEEVYRRLRSEGY